MEKKEKRICFLSTGDIKTNGIIKRAFGLANPLSVLGWDVSIILLDTQENRHKASLECSEKIKLLFFPSCGRSEERAIKSRLIKESQASYIYILGYGMRNTVKTMRNQKVIVENAELPSHFDHHPLKDRLYAYFFEYLSILQCDCFVNASKFLDDIFKKRCKLLFNGKKPMVYLPYAYNKSIYKLVLASEIQEKSDLENKTLFVFLGSVTRGYGVFDITDAAMKVAEKSHDFKVLILGGGEHLQELREYIKKQHCENIVETKGYVPEEDIPEYFSMASAFVSPMNDTIIDWARCPSKLYLYLPFKKPIITCKIGEPYYTLQDKGLYYTPGDTDGMAKQMLKVISGEVNKLDIDENKHTWDTRAYELSTFLSKTF